MTPPETAVRAAVQEIFADTFDDEGWTAADDKLPRAAGKDGHAEAACYPERAYGKPGQVIELVIPVVVQLYLAYDPSPDEYIRVDPGVIEGYADRFRVAFDDLHSGDSDFWFMGGPDFDYPDDPTGNKSRFEARVEGHAHNLGNTP